MGKSSQNFMLKLKIFEMERKPKNGKIYAVATGVGAIRRRGLKFLREG